MRIVQGEKGLWGMNHAPPRILEVQKLLRTSEGSGSLGGAEDCVLWCRGLCRCAVVVSGWAAGPLQPRGGGPSKPIRIKGGGGRKQARRAKL